MANGIQLFKNNEFGTLRVVSDENGEPWFIVNDICSHFGITNKNRVLQHVDAEDKGGTQIETPGGMQTVTTVSESGLYSILFYIQPTKARGLTEEEVSDKCERVRKFKRWVTHEVLPSIRKHGGYMAGQEQMTPEEMVLRSMRWLESKVTGRGQVYFVNRYHKPASQ